MERLTDFFPVYRGNNLSVTFCVDRTMDRTPFHGNWDLCALCQGESKNDKLVSSVNCTRGHRPFNNYSLKSG